MRALALLAALAAGCVRTTQPVLKEEQLVVDNELAGKWVSKDGKQTVEIQPAGEDKTYKVLYTDEDGKKAPLLGRLGKIGDVSIAEFHVENPVPDASDVYKAHLLPLYSFMIVQQTKPQLVVAVLSPDWLKKYLDAHPDELQVARPDKENSIVTSPTADFQAFLLRHLKDEGALGEPQTFVREKK